MKDVLGTTRRLYRHARRYDLVPNLPATDMSGHVYKHVDVGYRLTPNAEGPNATLWNERRSEINTIQFNDGYPLDDSWQFHCEYFAIIVRRVREADFFRPGPPRYYEAIKKILDTPGALKK